MNESCNIGEFEDYDVVTETFQFHQVCLAPALDFEWTSSVGHVEHTLAELPRKMKPSITTLSTSFGI